MLEHLLCMFGSLVIGIGTAWFLLRSEVAEVKENYAQRIRDFISLDSPGQPVKDVGVISESAYQEARSRVRTLELQAIRAEEVSARLREELSLSSRYQREAEQSMLLIREWERKFNVANAQLVSLDHLKTKLAS